MPKRYTRASLADAVSSSRTLSDALRALGRQPTASSRGYVRKLLVEWDIDATHLEREGVRHTESRLRWAVRHSTCLVDVLRRLGIAPVGGNQAHIAGRIAALGIDTSHFTAGRGPRRSPQPRAALVLREPSLGRVPGGVLHRALLARGVPDACAECGTGPRWNGKPLRLQVDHRNGCWWDNRPENLRLLCPNCHAVTGNFRGRLRSPAHG
ncbi:HNH endonuclease [Streptomyces sp. TRM70308]|uniref:HNH endonuclease n=1 Tax=Streptomyces sp. TRM70308 TaxID=3131932 RepID=UPI003CFE2DD9